MLIRRRRCALVAAMLAAVVAAGCKPREEAPPGERPPAVSDDRTAPSPPDAPALTTTRATHQTPPETGCMTSSCHADLAEPEYVHGPVAVGGCDACHEDEQPEHKFPLKRPGNETCTLCHVALVGKPFAHAVVSNGPCTACHDPHGSPAKFLLASNPVEPLCRSCHPSTETGRFKHGPMAAGACTACHLPHEADNQMLTIGSGPEHCYRCHVGIKDRVEQARVAHKPVRESCTACHAPHVSDFEKMLKADAAEQCLSCHSDVEQQVRSATARHGAVFTAKQCGNCHDVHGSTEPSLLRAPVAELCLSCHDQPQTAYDGHAIPEMKTKLTGSRFLHGPVRQGDCQACHQVHGSSNERLLAKFFGGDFYQGFDVANYALCFSCHEQALVLDRETTTLTGFRNGSQNLHYLHVNRPEKGRSCRACHEIHGSDRPKHMAESVAFEGGGWAMPIGFKKTETGGGCAPGCHQPYEYDRAEPVKYPSREGGPP